MNALAIMVCQKKIFSNISFFVIIKNSMRPGKAQKWP